jgi:hypothetical protein
MTTRMSDLNDHLFAQLRRLADESLTPEQIETEVKRSEAIVALADQVTGNADLQLKAAKLFAEHGSAILPHLPRIGKAAE